MSTRERLKAVIRKEQAQGAAFIYCEISGNVFGYDGDHLVIVSKKQGRPRRPSGQGMMDRQNLTDFPDATPAVRG